MARRFQRHGSPPAAVRSLATQRVDGPTEHHFGAAHSTPFRWRLRSSELRLTCRPHVLEQSSSVRLCPVFPCRRRRWHRSTRLVKEPPLSSHRVHPSSRVWIDERLHFTDRDGIPIGFRPFSVGRCVRSGALADCTWRPTSGRAAEHTTRTTEVTATVHRPRRRCVSSVRAEAAITQYPSCDLTLLKKHMRSLISVGHAPVCTHWHGKSDHLKLHQWSL